MVINYFIIFFALLVAATLVIHYFINANNLAVLLFIASIIIDGFFCYYVSLSVASSSVKIEIDNDILAINKTEEGWSENILLTDIIEYELINRRIAPKDIVILRLADKRKIELLCKLPWTKKSDDFESLVAYFKKRPQVDVNELPSDLPTAE